VAVVVCVRVFKGKKMPGRMGSERVTVQNLKVLKVCVSKVVVVIVVVVVHHNIYFGLCMSD
jgi:large subunit ribosomal protein L3